VDIFIAGENIDLAVPDEAFATGETWYRWLNRRDITRYLNHGLYPKIRTDQLEFLRSVPGNRLLLAIITKEEIPVGIVSLSGIDSGSASGDLALFIDSSAIPALSPLAALESVARIVQHGIFELGLKRIGATQHPSLSGWQQRMELVGFRFEGVARYGFVRGAEVADSVLLSCIDKDAKTLVAGRGELWDGNKNMLRRIRSLPDPAFANKMRGEIESKGNEYYAAIYAL